MYVFVLSGSSQILRPTGGRMNNLAAFSRVGRAGRWTVTGHDSKLFMDRVLKSALCHLFMGGLLLLAGVLVTASTLHGENDNVHGHLFVIGPILLVAGIVALARVMFKRAKGQQRRRRGCRRLREDHPPSPGAQAERNERRSSDTAIYLEPTGFGDDCYEDNPPPYDVVANDYSFLVPGRSNSSNRSTLCSHGGAMDNPALEDSDNDMPPPSYDEVIHMQETTGGAAVPPPYLPRSASRPDGETNLTLTADPDSGCSSGSHISITPDFADDSAQLPGTDTVGRVPRTSLSLANLDTMQQTQV